MAYVGFPSNPSLKLYYVCPLVQTPPLSPAFSEDTAEFLGFILLGKLPNTALAVGAGTLESPRMPLKTYFYFLFMYMAHVCEHPQRPEQSVTCLRPGVMAVVNCLLSVVGADTGSL